MRVFLIIILSVLSLSCVSVPKEAPQLSHEMGVQLQELEQAHLILIQKFFDGKKKEIKAFIDEEWTPLFAENFFNQPAISEAWEEIVNTDDKEARMEFITLIAPQMQLQIGKKYQEVIQPIEELENLLVQSVREKYNHSYEMNRILTDYLSAASGTSEIRWKYLEKAGVEQADINKIIDQIDLLTDKALNAGENLEDLEVKFHRLKDELKELLTF